MTGCQGTRLQTGDIAGLSTVTEDSRPVAASITYFILPLSGPWAWVVPRLSNL